MEGEVAGGAKEVGGGGDLSLKLFNFFPFNSRKEERMYFSVSFCFLSQLKLEGDGVYLSHST